MKTFTSSTSVFVRIITFGLVLSAFSLTAEAQQGAGQTVSPKSQAQVDALWEQADSADRKGQNEKALAYYQQALPLAKAVGDKWDQADILSNMGVVYSDTGQPQKALDYFQQALSLAQVLGGKSLQAAKWEQANILSDIGNVYSDTGQPQKARDYNQQALHLAQAGGDKSQQAIALISIGQVYLDTGQPQKALDYFQQVLLLAQAVGNKAVEATISSYMDAITKAAGKP